MSRVLVCDGEQRAALAAVRSLGRAGHHVRSCSHRARTLAAASRYARGSDTVPNAMTDPEGFVAAVSRVVRSEGVDVVLPVTDSSTAALLEHRHLLGGAVVPGPAAADFRRICDKRLLLAEGAALGLATPRQVVLADPAAAASLEPATLPFPLVIKASASVRGARHWTVRHAADPRALRSALAGLPDSAYPLLLQQRIVGPGCAVFLLVWEGRTLATFAHRRRREYPLSGGASVFCESVAADPALVARSRALLDRFAWQGAAMVEYKLETATSTPYLMEVNGRLWGSLQLAVDAGVDFPRLLVEAATGRISEPVHSYRVGVGLRSWWRDVEALLVRLRRSHETLNLPPDAPSKLEAVADFLRWRPGHRNEILRLDDPRPFWVETRSVMRRGPSA